VPPACLHCGRLAFADDAVLWFMAYGCATPIGGDGELSSRERAQMARMRAENPAKVRPATEYKVRRSGVSKRWKQPEELLT
jgi:hypothetical protein